MSGAARLAGESALRGGAGLVTVAVPRCILDQVASAHPCYMTLPLADERGGIAEQAGRDIESRQARHTAVGLGPGLGTATGTARFVTEFYANCPMPVVLDADGLNAFATTPEQLGRRANEAPRVLTPHPGEFSRLTGVGTDEIQQQRETIAVEFAAHHNVVLLLKGPGTIVTDGRQLAVNATGNVALAKGGSGDVLTGLITALLAQGMTAFEAARLGAHLHGLAGDVMADRHAGEYATAVELLGCLDDAWKTFHSA